MASWKKVITSGSSAHLKAIEADGNISSSLTSTPLTALFTVC